MEDMLAEARTMLSCLCAAAGLVLAPKSEGALRHIEFVPLGSGRALVVLVTALDAGAAEEGLIPLVASLTQNHVVVVASVRDPAVDAARLERSTPPLAYRAAAAAHALNPRAPLTAGPPPRRPPGAETGERGGRQGGEPRVARCLWDRRGCRPRRTGQDGRL